MPLAGAAAIPFAAAMKLPRAVALIGIALAEPATAVCLPGPTEPAHVAAIADARTLELADGRLVRPAAIESFALIGEDAAHADAVLAEGLTALLAGRQAHVHFTSDKPDRYGRLAALIATADGLVQARLAAEGVALALPDADGGPCTADILAAEAAARSQKAGLWAEIAVLPARPGALSPHLGGYVIFEGRVLSVGNRTRRTYLNFGRRWSEDVTVIIESRDRDSFGGAEALEALAGRRVRVRGFVEERGGPLVTVRWTGQIEVLQPRDGEGDGS